MSANGSGQDVEQVYVDIAMGMKDSELYFLPRLLKKLFTLEEATIVRELPAPFAEVADKLGLSEEQVAQTCKKLVKEGRILQTDKGPRAFNFGAQFGDILMANPAIDSIRDQEFTQLNFGYVTSPEIQKNAKYRMAEGIRVDGKPINRVVPHWKAIRDIPGVMPCEDMRDILESYKDTLNTTRCICRTGLEDLIPPCSMKEGRGTAPEDGTCIHIGKMAEYFTDVMELTPYRSVEGILETIEGLHGKVYYQMGPNDRDVHWICNCCLCHCAVAGVFLRDPELALSEMLEKSRFLPIVDAYTCESCGTCVTMCPFRAIELIDGKPQINEELCYGCGNCVVNCSSEAITMKIVRPAEHVPEGGAQMVDVEVLEVRVLPKDVA